MESPAISHRAPRPGGSAHCTDASASMEHDRLENAHGAALSGDAGGVLRAPGSTKRSLLTCWWASRATGAGCIGTSSWTVPSAARWRRSALVTELQ
jgi:hypothetical protein